MVVVGPAPAATWQASPYNHKKIDVSKLLQPIENYHPNIYKTWHELQVTPD